MNEQRRVRIAVLFGGRSSEHAISCVSAGSVLAALDPAVYDVVRVGITQEGRWVLAGPDQQLAITDGTLPEVVGGSALALPGDPTAGGLKTMDAGGLLPGVGDVDVVFPLLHGAYGEDGTVQGLLELAGIPYVGSGVFASAAAMDKAHMKAMLISAGLPVGPYAVIAPRTGSPTALEQVRHLGLPLFVKPARGGSSLGISRVTNLDAFDAALAHARSFDPKVVVEAAVAGREIECGVLGGLDGAAPSGSVPAEIVVVGGQDFYDFEAKYLSEATVTACPADLPAEVTEAVQTMAVAAFEALDCAGLARVDFFWDAQAGLVVNEVNTMPGFTPVSMFPKMWAASGVAYPQLVDHLIRLALETGTGLR